MKPALSSLLNLRLLDLGNISSEKHEETLYEPVGSLKTNDYDDIHTQIEYVNLAKMRRWSRWTLWLSGAMFLTSIGVFVAGWKRPPTQLECDKLMSPWSSMWDAVEYEEGDLTNYFNHSSIYRGPPTPEREQAWEDLWHWPGMPVTPEGVAALNKTQYGPFVQIEGSDPENPVYGSIVEAFHQLHCLNLVRQYTWLDHYDPEDPWYPHDLAYPVGGRMHVDHCLEALRLSLMCYADITPVLIMQDEERGAGRQSDFSVHHKCRKFENLVDWIQENGVSIPFDLRPADPINDPTTGGGHDHGH